MNHLECTTVMQSGKCHICRQELLYCAKHQVYFYADGSEDTCLAGRRR